MMVKGCGCRASKVYTDGWLPPPSLEFCLSDTDRQEILTQDDVNGTDLR